MTSNLELHKKITFDELVKHGLENGANVVNGMPWSWKINGKSVTHENDNVYLIETDEGIERFERGCTLVAFQKSTFTIFEPTSHDTHAPGSCPL